MTQSNKEIAVSFLSQVISSNIAEAYNAYIASDFRHHNPYFKGDAATLQAGMQENEEKFPNKTFVIQKVLEDGDLVAVYSKLQMKSDMPIMAVVHIFRFENGRIAELWDVGQEMPKDSLNEHGLF